MPADLNGLACFDMVKMTILRQGHQQFMTLRSHCQQAAVGTIKEDRFNAHFKTIQLCAVGGLYADRLRPQKKIGTLTDGDRLLSLGSEMKARVGFNTTD